MMASNNWICTSSETTIWYVKPHRPTSVTKPPSRIPAARRQGLQEIFGANLRAARTELGMTQKALADAIGVHAHAHISRIENGGVNVSLDTANNLAKAIGCTVIDLLRSDRDQADVEIQTSGTAPIRQGDLALELPAGQAFDVAVTAAAKLGSSVRLIDPATRECKSVVPHHKI